MLIIFRKFKIFFTEAQKAQKNIGENNKTIPGKEAKQSREKQGKKSSKKYFESQKKSSVLKGSML